MPTDRKDNTIWYQFDSIGKVKKFYLGISNLAVARQSSVPPKSDLVTPPAGYDLWGAEAGCSIPFFKKQIDLSLRVTNRTNVSYPDYLDRFCIFIFTYASYYFLKEKSKLQFYKEGRTRSEMDVIDRCCFIL